MKAIQIAAFGNPVEVARCVDIPEPASPGTGQVTIRVESSPINPSDLFMMTGRYGYRPPLPAVMGAEGAGTVVAVGPDVRHLKEGDRVIVPYQTPTWAEKVTASAGWLAPLPTGNLDQFAMLGVNPATAYLLLHEMLPLQPGEWVIHNGANSAVGRALIVIAKHLQLRTINVVRRPELLGEITSLGGDIALVDGPDLSKRVVQAIGKSDVRLAIDVVGDRATLNLLGCLANAGLLVTYGAVSGKPSVTAAPHFIFRGITMKGFWLVNWFERAPAERIRDMYKLLAPMVADGSLHTPILEFYGLEDVERALLAAAKGVGKVIFRI